MKPIMFGLLGEDSILMKRRIAKEYSRRYGLSCRKEQVRVDVVGLSFLRKTALNLMISRSDHPQLLIHKRDSFMPNMLDDPFHAEQILYLSQRASIFGIEFKCFFWKSADWRRG